ncbi:hypothetical protein [Rummeliibacillus sp. POC4]|uniref:hypothetical protein n=1 Tax=Rummeliibacillus sp. POC4 TaxID=2305899 RepID=UPI003511959F
MDKRYPIGQFECPNLIQKQDVQKWMKEIAALPNRLNKLTESLDEFELERTYREGS